MTTTLSFLRKPLPLAPWLIAALLPLLLSVFAPHAHAGDAALYGPAAPPGSTFVRVFNGSEQADLKAQVGSQAIDEIPAWGASEFVFLPAGTHTLKVGGASKSANLQADRYYTAVAENGQLQLIDNPRYDNRMKALVILYNLTDAQNLSLRTADGKGAVVENVAADKQGSREVNPAKARLAVYGGEQRVAEAPPVSLARGRAFSLFAVGDAAAPKLVWAIN